MKGEEREDQNITKSDKIFRPPAERHLNGHLKGAFFKTIDLH